MGSASPSCESSPRLMPLTFAAGGRRPVVGAVAWCRYGTAVVGERQSAVVVLPGGTYLNVLPQLPQLPLRPPLRRASDRLRFKPSTLTVHSDSALLTVHSAH